VRPSRFAQEEGASRTGLSERQPTMNEHMRAAWVEYRDEQLRLPERLRRDPDLMAFLRLAFEAGYEAASS
jgi:hypothetical protein